MAKCVVKCTTGLKTQSFEKNILGPEGVALGAFGVPKFHQRLCNKLKEPAGEFVALTEPGAHRFVIVVTEILFLLPAMTNHAPSLRLKKGTSVFTTLHANFTRCILVQSL